MYLKKLNVYKEVNTESEARILKEQGFTEMEENIDRKVADDAGSMIKSSREMAERTGSDDETALADEPAAEGKTEGRKSGKREAAKTT